MDFLGEIAKVESLNNETENQNEIAQNEHTNENEVKNDSNDSNEEMTTQTHIDAFLNDEDDDHHNDDVTKFDNNNNNNNDINDNGDDNGNNPGHNFNLHFKMGGFFQKKKKKKKRSKKKHEKHETDDLADNDDSNFSPMNSYRPPPPPFPNDNYDTYNDYGMDPFQPPQLNNENISIEQCKMQNLVGGATPWNCEKCTFLNPASELHCVMCFYSRFEVKNLSAQWQWKAAERWITYGIPETTEIETAYKNGEKSVPLTKGWFAQNPNLYSIEFEKKKKKKYFVQLNSQTQTMREVRRIAEDDDDLFCKLKLDYFEDEKDKKCMICLMEFTEKDEMEGIIVQLSTCKNHGFHKECIVQWVQLKGNCPLCRINVKTQN